MGFSPRGGAAGGGVADWWCGDGGGECTFAGEGFGSGGTFLATNAASEGAACILLGAAAAGVCMCPRGRQQRRVAKSRRLSLHVSGRRSAGRMGWEEVKS
jgi:hypothetical protein